MEQTQTEITTNVNASRNLNIELLRVIAVFSIVFYHYFITMLSLPSDIYFFFEALAQVAMITFFAISGFGLYLHFEKSYRSYPQFLKHRLSHLLPHYYLSIIFVIVSSGTVFLSTWGIKIVISHFLCIQNLSLTWQSNINGVTWTVALMVQFYLISPLIYRLIKKDSRFVCLFIIIALVCRYLSGVIVTQLEADSIYYVICNIRQLPMTIDIFALGMLAAKISSYKKDILCKIGKLGHRLSLLAFLATLLLIVTCYFLLISSFGVWDPTTSPVLWVISWETILGIALSGLLIGLRHSNTIVVSNGGGIIGRTVQRLSACSMIVYYYHMILRDNLLNSGWISFLYANFPIAAILIIVIIVMLFSMWLSRFEFSRTGKK